MDKKSLLKMYKGTRALGATQPILILLADNTLQETEHSCFAEYFLFHQFSEIPFLYGREWYEKPYGPDGLVEFSTFPQLFATDTLFAREYDSAMGDLQMAIWKLDRVFYRELFFSEQKLDFREEINDTYLMRFKVLHQYADELRTMFAFTKSAELKNFEQKLAQVPEFICKHEP